MTDKIREMLHRKPFEPFRVITTSGERYVVRKRHWVALMKSEVFIARPNSDRFTFVPLRHIDSVEALANPRPPRPRGGRHRR